MKSRTTAALAILTAGIVLTSMAACSTRADSDMIILYYKNGAGDNKIFQECIQPGKAGSYPIE